MKYTYKNQKSFIFILFILLKMQDSYCLSVSHDNPLQLLIDRSKSTNIKKIFDEELQLSLIVTIEHQQQKQNIDDYGKCSIKINFLIKDHNQSSLKVDMYLRKLRFEKKLSQSNDLVACAYIYYKHQQRVIPDVSDCSIIAAGKYGLFWCRNGDCYSNELFKKKFYVTKGLFDVFARSTEKEIDELYNQYVDKSVFELLSKKIIKDFSLTDIPYKHRSYDDVDLTHLINYLRYNPVKFLTECQKYEVKKIQKIIKEVILYDSKSIEEMVKVLQSLQKAVEQEIKRYQVLLSCQNNQKQLDDESCLQLYQKLLEFIIEEQKGFNIL